jgi:hypothetical protein
LTPAEAIKAIEQAGGRVLRQGDAVSSVFLNRTSIDDKQLRPVRFLPTVRVLNLSGTRVTNAGLEHLQPLVDLERLYYYKTAITIDGLRLLKQTAPKLRPMPEPEGWAAGGK